MLNDTDRTLPPVRRRTRPAALPPANPSQTTPGDGTRLVEPPGSVRASAEPAGEPVNKSGNYEVGYAKPPRHSRFKPGQSGNPKGRPKQAKSLNTIIRSRMLETVQVKTGQGIKRVSRVEALLMKALEAGSRGDLRAIERLLVMYAAAVPETQAESGPMHSTSAIDLSAADELTLALMRSEFAAELGSGATEEGAGSEAQEDGDA